MPLVSVVMGSKSDLAIMRDASETLDLLGISSECRIVSAHRTPEFMFDYARTAAERGIEIVIAGAGGAAHLPGMIASITELPVIGVPIPSKHLNGLDSLLSIVQMPSGIPVATVAIGNAKNAALLAARMLGLKHSEIMERVRRHMREQTDSVMKEKLD